MNKIYIVLRNNPVRHEFKRKMLIIALKQDAREYTRTSLEQTDIIYTNKEIYSC